MYPWDFNMLIENNTFTHNIGKYDRGALKIVSIPNFNLTNNTFTNNTSEYEGGAISIIESIQ